MSSYHSSFSYLDKNSNTDFKWLIVHFDADNGETDGFMTQEQVFDETYRGTKRIVYGTKWTSVAEIKITVIKQDRTDFTVQECRDAYRWLAGNNQASWLKLYSSEKPQCEFLVTNADVKPQKLDSRTVGLNIYFESVSPWAYSPIQTRDYVINQKLSVSDDGVLTTGNPNTIKIDGDGVLYNNGQEFSVDNYGAVYIDNTSPLTIDNQSDDLYTYVYLDTIFINGTCDSLSIKNSTLDEETRISGLVDNEVITLSAGQFIMSNVSYNKIFGNDFNWTWPRLGPGENKFVIDGNGEGTLQFTYRYPIKIGDCAIDIDAYDSKIGCL